MKNYFSAIFFLCFLLTNAQNQWTEASALEFQKKMNKEFSTKDESPLTDEDFKDFKQLDFYPINSKFAVEATFVKSKNEKSFKMKTTGTRTPEYIKYGELHFEIDGKKMSLNLYQNIELNKRRKGSGP